MNSPHVKIFREYVQTPTVIEGESINSSARISLPTEQQIKVDLLMGRIPQIRVENYHSNNDLNGAIKKNNNNLETVHENLPPSVRLHTEGGSIISGSKRLSDLKLYKKPLQ